jgi:hypothetical protein
MSGDTPKEPILKKVDAVLIKVPEIQAGLDFYCIQLGMTLRWQKDDAAAVRLGDSELVLSTKFSETDILVDSVPEAVKAFIDGGGDVIVEPEGIPVGMVAVVRDPFGNELTLVDLSKGLYQTDETGKVIGVK